MFSSIVDFTVADLSYFQASFCFTFMCLCFLSLFHSGCYFKNVFDASLRKFLKRYMCVMYVCIFYLFKFHCDCGMIFSEATVDFWSACGSLRLMYLLMPCVPDGEISVDGGAAVASARGRLRQRTHGLRCLGNVPEYPRDPWLCMRPPLPLLFIG